VILAGLGAFVLRDRRQAMIILTLLLPSILAVTFLQFGGVQWGLANYQGIFYLAALPRFAYIAYPGIYLLAAIALAELHSAVGLVAGKWLAPSVVSAIPWLVIALAFALSNLDVFGHPQMYYLFYYPEGGRF
jgi:hypothetical protein